MVPSLLTAGAHSQPDAGPIRPPLLCLVNHLLACMWHSPVRRYLESKALHGLSLDAAYQYHPAEYAPFRPLVNLVIAGVDDVTLWMAYVNLVLPPMTHFATRPSTPVLLGLSR